jgi:hypothetical protein
MDVHLAGCPSCALEMKSARRLISALAEIEAPALPAGFEQRLHARLLNETEAMRQPATPARRRVSNRIGAWSRGFAAGLATCAVAGLALFFVVDRSTVPMATGVGGGKAIPAAFTGTHLSMGDDAVVNIRFDAARAVQGVRFSITLPEGVRAVVNGKLIDSASLTWTGDLSQGANRIPLKVRGVARGEWTVTATLEKGSARREKSIGVHVNGV